MIKKRRYTCIYATIIALGISIPAFYMAKAHTEQHILPISKKINDTSHTLFSNNKCDIDYSGNNTKPRLFCFKIQWKKILEILGEILKTILLINSIKS